MPLYFAYGSNLKAARLRERVGPCRVAGVARLRGFRLACDKPGRDGSGKANLHADPAPTAEVWGALYELAASQLDALDAFEGGYARIEVEVEPVAAPACRAITYRSDLHSSDPPSPLYRTLLLEGAREHGLPEAAIARLEQLPKA